MLGRYYDTRAQHRFSVIHTAVPYLDTEIFNMKNKLLIEERKAKNRTSKAIEGTPIIYMSRHRKNKTQVRTAIKRTERLQTEEIVRCKRVCVQDVRLPQDLPRQGEELVDGVHCRKDKQ